MEYVNPDTFKFYEEQGRKIGLNHILLHSRIFSLGCDRITTLSPHTAQVLPEFGSMLE